MTELSKPITLLEATWDTIIDTLADRVAVLQAEQAFEGALALADAIEKAQQELEMQLGRPHYQGSY